MSDDRTLLERQMQRVELRPFTLDGFHRQRSRQQRNRRIGAAVVAVTVAAVAIGGLLRAISSGQVPAEEPAPTPVDLGFTSTIHGISIDPPSVWETRPATEPWAGEPLDFDSPAADVLFHPALGEGLYMVVASQPYGELSQDEWRNRAVDWLCRPSEGSAAGSWTVDGADAFVLACGSTASAALIFTDSRGYVIRLVVSSEVPFADAYDWDWHKVVLETVDLRPEEALDGPSPSESL